MQFVKGLLQPHSGNMSLQEVTLERITKTNTSMVMVVLSSVYNEMKQLPGKDKGTWWKAIVRLVDQKGQGLYAEIRGSTERDVRKRAQEFYQPRFIQLTQAVVVQNSTFLCGFSADVTHKGKVSPIAEAHPTAMQLRGLFPIARSDLGVLAEHAQGKERADLIGKVTQKEVPSMKVRKVTLWLKDESEQELAVHLWGGRFVDQGTKIAIGDVIQVDNALVSRIPAGVEASCEHWMDSSRNWFSAMHVDPKGPRVERLKSLEDGRGEALSVPWLQSASRRMVSDGLEKFISCCATVSSCCLALTDAMLEAGPVFTVEAHN